MSGIRITKPSANPRTRVLICILSLEVSVPVGSDRRANGFELSRPARYSASYSKFTNQDLDYQIAQRAGSAAANGYAALRLPYNGTMEVPLPTH